MSSSSQKVFLTNPGRVKSGFENRYLEKIQHVPENNWGIPGFSPLLIQKQEDFIQSQKLLDETRVQQKNWQAEHKAREIQFKLKKEKFEAEEMSTQLTIYKNIQEINKYKEIEQHELELTQKCEDKLADLETNEIAANEKLQKLEKEMQELQPFAEFIDHIINETKQFDSIEAILQRFDFLTQSDQFADDESNLPKKVSSNSSYVKHHQEKENLFLQHDKLKQQLLEKNRQFILLNEKIEQLKKEKRYELQDRIRLEERNFQKQSELLTILSSIKNISDQAFKTQEFLGKNSYSSPPVELNAQLDLIERKLKDLQLVIEKNKQQYGNK
jgi:hypothetical protein